jgi:hypothetical protein
MNNHDLMRPCGLCGKPVCKSGVPLFWQLTIQRHGINARKLRQLQGVTHLLGNFKLAEVMTGIDDVTQPIGPAVELLVCEACCTQPLEHHCVASLAEVGADQCKEASHAHAG